MSGSVRERRSGVWELRPYLGRDPLTGKKRYGSRVLSADAYVFSDDVLGEHPWRPDSTSRKYRHIRWWVAGLSESRLHDLRHFTATQLLGAGNDPKVVAQRGGWSKVATMLDRYAHAARRFPSAPRIDAATMSDQPGTPWLFPGRHAGRLAGPVVLGERLRAIGIEPIRMRNTARAQLAAEIPLALLSELIGVNATTATCSGRPHRRQLDLLRPRPRPRRRPRSQRRRAPTLIT